MPSFSLHTLLAATSVLFLMATPSLGGVLCSKVNTADSKQTVVAQLEKHATDDKLALPVTEADDQSFTAVETDPSSSSTR